MSKAGPILGIIGGGLILYAGFIQMQDVFELLMLFSQYGFDPSDFGLEVAPLHVTYIMTYIWGFLGFLGGSLALRLDKNIICSVLCTIAGVGGSIGLFLTFYSDVIDFGHGIEPIYFTLSLNVSFILVDPFIIAIGGVLNIVLKPKLKEVPEIREEIKPQEIIEPDIPEE